MCCLSVPFIFLSSVYSCAPSLVQAVEELQTAFQSQPAYLYGLKLVLNLQKTKFLTRARTLPENVSIVTSGGLSIEKSVILQIPRYLVG